MRPTKWVNSIRYAAIPVTNGTALRKREADTILTIKSITINISQIEVTVFSLKEWFVEYANFWIPTREQTAQ